MHPFTQIHTHTHTHTQTHAHIYYTHTTAQAHATNSPNPQTAAHDPFNKVHLPFVTFAYHIPKMSTGTNAFTTLRGLLIVIPWALGLVLMDVILSLLLPISYFLPDPVYDASSFVASTIWKWIQLIFYFNGGEITMSGDDLPPGESAIVISNHVSWTDFYMIQALAIKAGMLGRCRWFAKIELRWVPLLGWGIWAMGMPMVSRQWTKDKAELDRVFAGITQRKWPTCKPLSLSLSLSLPIGV
jgi:hypothetical protein